jgi:hypothetical protein
MLGVLKYAIFCKAIDKGLVIVATIILKIVSIYNNEEIQKYVEEPQSGE